MYYGRKKGIIIAIVVVAIILILGIAGTCVYMFTDLFKSSEDLFWKYMGQTLENMQGVENTQMSDIQKLKNQSPYIVEGELTADYIGENEQISNVLDKAKITVNGQIDKTDDYAYSNLKLDYDNNAMFELKCVKDEDIYALKSDEIVSAYIGIKNENLKVLAQKLFGNDMDVSAIPNSIDFSNNTNLLKISEEAKSNIINTYASVIKEGINKNNYSKQTQAVIEKDGVQYETTSYRVDISATEISDIIINILNVLKQDNMTLNIISSKMLELGLDEDESSISNIMDKIDEIIDEVSNKEFTDTSFVVYAYKGEAIATEVIVRNTAKITFEGNQNELLIKIENLSDTDEYKVITLEVKNQITATKTTTTVTVDIDGQTSYLNMQNTGSAAQMELDTQVELTFSINGEDVTLSYSQIMEFVDELENIEELTDTNCAVLNDYSTDNLTALMNALVQQTIFVLNSKIQTLNVM